MNANRKIRVCDQNDFDALADVMFDAVRNGRSAFTEEQRRAWVPEVRRGVDWTSRLASQLVLAAEDDGQIVGFISLADKGYVDLAYIRPGSQGTGLFRQLYREIENAGRERGESRLWVHASPMAQPAFAAVGFEILNEESVEIGTQTLRRFVMEKVLESA